MPALIPKAEADRNTGPDPIAVSPERWRRLQRGDCNALLRVIARAARLANAPKVKLDLQRTLGDGVAMGEALHRVYADFASGLAFARPYCRQHSAYTPGRPGQVPHAHVEF